MSRMPALPAQETAISQPSGERVGVGVLLTQSGLFWWLLGACLLPATVQWADAHFTFTGTLVGQ